MVSARADKTLTDITVHYQPLAMEADTASSAGTVPKYSIFNKKYFTATSL
jgi:hypothetical protein